VQQTTACNALHTVEQRMCKWLVRMYDLVGSQRPLTQEFLAQMMGVQRTSVSGVAKQLQSEGLISYRRGHVTIINIDLVERRTCECPQTLRELDLAEFGEEGAPMLRNGERPRTQSRKSADAEKPLSLGRSSAAHHHITGGTGC